MALNAAWHRAHVMPKHPTQAQRLAWHLAHAEHCGCRPMPAGLMLAAQAVRARQAPTRRTKRLISSPAR